MIFTPTNILFNRYIYIYAKWAVDIVYIYHNRLDNYIVVNCGSMWEPEQHNKYSLFN